MEQPQQQPPHSAAPCCTDTRAHLYLVHKKKPMESSTSGTCKHITAICFYVLPHSGIKVR